EQAKYLMKLHTRHYVKRQMTWFRRDLRIQWIDILPGQTQEDIAELMINL
ncbi:MAG: tRNA (adenosine(37)-N6)-dimethylallyltransferase MiaA, partial [Candidatus Omnitrophica bacterium]|nr:tRNA (adenosine(37)-N6)-dimethylallyltransferase MiaA [Candidatus Omnitrophota bacterium]